MEHTQRQEVWDKFTYSAEEFQRALGISGAYRLVSVEGPRLLGGGNYEITVWTRQVEVQPADDQQETSVVEVPRAPARRTAVR